MGSCISKQIVLPSSLRTEVNLTSIDDGGSDTSKPSSKVASVVVPSNSVTRGQILQSPNLKSFTFRELAEATGNFCSHGLLGQGNFGYVYKGCIDEQSLDIVNPDMGMAIAVKMLNQNGCQGQQEWLVEIKYLGLLCHPNLVKLIGYCLEDGQRLLVYEFIPRSSLETHIFTRSPSFQPLAWNLRMKVALGAARGLAFLHDEAHVIYRDFKTSDILLDMDYNAKLTDFGLARDGPIDGRTHVSTRIMGNQGYAAPEYMATGHLTTKSDVYSFGVVFLETLSGRRVIDRTRPLGEQNLVEWARPYLDSKRNSFRVLDRRLDGQCSFKAVQVAFRLALKCLSADPRLRPNMQEVVKDLEQLYIPVST